MFERPGRHRYFFVARSATQLVLATAGLCALLSGCASDGRRDADAHAGHASEGGSGDHGSDHTDHDSDHTDHDSDHVHDMDGGMAQDPLDTEFEHHHGDAAALHEHVDGGSHHHDSGLIVAVDPGSPGPGTVEDGFTWNLPPGFPVPPVPADNPMTPVKAELGRYLFYEKRLSENGTQSCGSCHLQELAFTDGKPVGIGSTGEAHTRGAMSLANVAYASTLTWGNPLMTELERQANAPLFGDAPVELGLRAIGDAATRIMGDPMYEEMFAEAFPEEDQPLTALNVKRAIAAFQRTLISGRSPFDRYYYDGEEDAINDAAKRGYALFNGHPFECFHCHTGFNFTDHVHWQDKPEFDAPYHNTGLYNVDGLGGFPAPNTGVYDVTRNPDDMGKFKAPSLRNIAVTAPYMHDGSIETLDGVLDHYAAGGRTIGEGPLAGDGSQNPYKDELVPGFDITAAERADIIAFLESLTDEEFLANPNFSDPWE